MSRSFRPVKETWYEASDQFVDRGTLQRVFEHVADQISSAYDVSEYSSRMTFLVENGSDFIRYIEKSEDFTAGNIAHDLYINLSDELVDLVSNMKKMAAQWRQALDDDGSLRFYAD